MNGGTVLLRISDAVTRIDFLPSRSLWRLKAVHTLNGTEVQRSAPQPGSQPGKGATERLGTDVDQIGIEGLLDEAGGGLGGRALKTRPIR